ncbi:hypothetical protein FDECE_4420 [Fusarium decemcellulare]|nr:hypothetical protein FDECE_4420 [Fusarium decemcellulare]
MPSTFATSPGLHAGNKSVRKRVSCARATSGSEPTEFEFISANDSDLERVDHQEAIDLGLPPLTFRPVVLQDIALGLSLVFYLFILAILVSLCINKEFTLLDAWAFFVVKPLPTIVGTITTAHLNALVLALSRITPFMLFADVQGRHDGAPACITLLTRYLPTCNTVDLIKSRSWLLVFGKVMLFVGDFLVALKASFLLTENYKDVFVVPWALYTLIAIYGLWCLLIAMVFFSLRGRLTGLRWDPVSIADQLVLFRHSDFLERFSGTCVAPRASLSYALGEQTRLRLGYWKKGCAYWHGFGMANKDQQKGRSQSSFIGTEREILVDDISYRRYSSASATVRPLTIWSFAFFILVLLVGSIVLVAMGSSREYQFTLPFSTDVAVSLVCFILVFFVSLCTDFCEALSYFVAETEPFVHLAKGGDRSGTGFGNASETLLLNYSSLILPEAIHTSFIKGHWKVFRIRILAKLQHLLPIIVAGSFTIYPEDDDRVMLDISLSLFVVIIIWLSACLIWVPFETLRCEDSRFLPRNLYSIADLLSWAYASSLLSGDLPVSTEYGFHDGDPLDMQFILNDQPSTRSQKVTTNDDGASKPGRHPRIKRTAYDREHLEARLILTNTRFCFGLNRLKNRDLYTVGICDTSTFHDELSRQKRHNGWLRHLWPTTKKYSRDCEQRNGTGYRIEGWKKFQNDLMEAEIDGIPLQVHPVAVREETEPEPRAKWEAAVGLCVLI